MAQLYSPGYDVNHEQEARWQAYWRRTAPQRAKERRLSLAGFRPGPRKGMIRILPSGKTEEAS